MMDSPSPLSDNIQMYLVSILRMGQGRQPVPLSQLGAALGVSAISVNQMCHKLQDEGWVAYVPYKGVSITPAGERVAARILRRHRLWEVFLVEHLQMGSEEAHETACRLEHATPDEVVERLALFLSHPQVNPEGEPIPASSGAFSTTRPRPMVEMEAGQSGYCIRCTADEASCAFLSGQGLRPGACFQVVAVAPNSTLVEVNGRRVSLDLSLAAAVLVEAGDQQARTNLASSEFPQTEHNG
jgi:DtxR family Mn-dependent transcriptional regulator